MKLKLHIVFYVLIGYCIIACSSQQKTLPKPQVITTNFTKKKMLSEAEKRNWHFKDVYADSILGISLEKAYAKILANKKGDTVIVALLDNRIDSKHEDIKDFIWTNNDEIPNNQIDDDNNGYVDDVNGWNFLGNINGENVDRANFETTRIVRKYQNVFESIQSKDIPDSLKKEYDLYITAKKMYNDNLNLINQRLVSLDTFERRKNDTYNYLSKIYHDSLLSKENIEKLTSKDGIVNTKITRYRYFLKHSNRFTNTRKVQNRYLTIYLGLNYKERLLIGDDVDNIKDRNYGNGNIHASKTSSHDHAIKIAGILGAKRNNNIGINGISNVLKIMPVCVSPSGDEQDKDIALGIRYAVDNGARIIIMTFSKSLVQHENWLSDALLYAEKKDVLIVLSAGNSSTNSDIQKTFPNDYNSKNIEYVNNVIVVGGIRNSLDERLVAEFSNYGKNTVDIFAPARSIYTTRRNDEYGYESGTSMSAPIVAGVTALIRSHYPNLTAAEVKQIIMKSGISLDIMVNKPSISKEKELVPFSSLSKSGKIVNAYNALLMAEEVSKKKKKQQ